MKGKYINIVLGGSFNPPTLAHRDLAIHAAGKVSEITGRPADTILVPSSDAYVRRKMAKQQVHGLCFREEARRDMCLAMLQGYGGAVDDIEFGNDGRGCTYETMRKLQDADPDNEYMFLAGADKLRIMPRWRSIEKFLSEFTIVVTARDGASAKKAIANDPVLSRFQDSFIVIPELDGPHVGASSTKARQAIAEGANLDGAAEICGYGVTKVIEQEYDAKRVLDLSRASARK